MDDKVTSEFKRFKPLILGAIQAELRLKGLSSSGSSGMQAHDLSGPYHIGTLGIAYVPDALDRNGTRALIGSLALGPGVLIGGVNLPDLKLDHDALASAYAAHAAATAVSAHGTVGAHDHQSTANGGLLDHGAALSGLGDDDHTQYAPAVGSAIARAAKDVDSTINKTWTGNHTFQGALVSRHHRPELNDTYDSGAEDYRWRQIFASELETILLKQKAVIAVDGEIILAKQNGTFDADVTDVQTTVNFGQAMTAGDIIYVAGNLKIEYMTVGTLNTAPYIYNVTRNVDGSGADPWTQGQAWINFGADGDMRIHIMGGSSNNPRVVLRRQGTAYNLTTDLLSLDSDGIAITASTGANDPLRSYQFVNTSGSLVSAIYAYATALGSGITVQADPNVVDDTLVNLIAGAAGAGEDAFLRLQQSYGLRELTLGASRVSMGWTSASRFAVALTFGGTAYPDAITHSICFREDWRMLGVYDGGTWRQLGTPTYDGAWPTSPPDGLRVFRVDFRAMFQYVAADTAWRQVSVGQFSGAFPASPITGLKVERTDYRMECYYDGTRWQTMHELPLAWLIYGGPTFSATTSNIAVTTLRGDIAAYLRRISINVVVATTHTASDYWTVTVANAGGTIWTFNTYDAGAGRTTAAGANARVETTSPTLQPTTGQTVINVSITKVGAPGNLTIYPGAWYRHVLT